MVQVVERDQQKVISPGLRIVRMAVFGLVAGVLFWVAYAAINHSLITPLACGGQYFSGDVCLNASLISGNIGVIFIGIISIASLIMLKEVRPLIISIPTVILLWPIGAWVEGLFWLEALSWSMLMFTACIMLFWLVAKIPQLVFSVGLSVLLVVGIKAITLLY